jgi:hypothetical protein
MYSTLYVKNIRVCRMHLWFNIHLPERLHSKNCFYWCFTHSLSLFLYFFLSSIPKTNREVLLVWCALCSTLSLRKDRDPFAVQSKQFSYRMNYLVFTFFHLPPPTIIVGSSRLTLLIPVIVGSFHLTFLFLCCRSSFLTLSVPIVVLGPFP